MTNVNTSIKDKIVSRYFEKPELNQSKSTDINVLLNRVKMNQKNESRRKIYFSAAASVSMVLFGLIIFS
tara:strand:+ start:359 stop:565 length:207 start_codon:yes stop_codon:yes gene_type:complete